MIQAAAYLQRGSVRMLETRQNSSPHVIGGCRGEQSRNKSPMNDQALQ